MSNEPRDTAVDVIAATAQTWEGRAVAFEAAAALYRLHADSAYAEELEAAANEYRTAVEELSPWRA